MKILLVGCGRMGSALLARWRGMDVEVADPAQNRAPREGFKPDAVVFAVKPQTLPDIIAQYKGTDALVISIAAGKPISFFEQHLGKARIVRAMPNTPAAIGAGITVACANAAAANDKASASQILGAVGEVLWVENESLLNPVTALSGSGPAYVFLLIEAMAEAGVKCGLPRDMSEKLARQTVIGSALLAKESADTPAKLREDVTSPNGTTAAALGVLMPAMQKLFAEAIAAATKRAEELAK